MQPQSKNGIAAITRAFPARERQTEIAGKMTSGFFRRMAEVGDGTQKTTLTHPPVPVGLPDKGVNESVPC